MATTTKVTVTDFSTFGETDANGNLKALDTSESIENALRAWLVSNKGENIRNPDRGGYLRQHISKPMTEDRLEEIRAAILEGLEQDFEPALVVSSLTLSPDYVNRRLSIHLVGFSRDYKATVNSNITVTTG